MKQILDDINDFHSKTHKSLEILLELTKTKLAPLVSIDGTRIWGGQGYKELRQASKEELAKATKTLEEIKELASWIHLLVDTAEMTIRTAEAYRQKALSVAEPFTGVSRKISEEDALNSITPEAAAALIAKLKARLGKQE